MYVLGVNDADMITVTLLDKYDVSCVCVCVCLWNFWCMKSGQSSAVADFNLLDTARKVELYGIQMHPAKVIDSQCL